MRSYWFKPKRHGIGAVPIRWQGWALAAAAILAILVEMQLLPRGAASLLAQASTAVAFLVVCRLKTDGGWRWRWER